MAKKGSRGIIPKVKFTPEEDDLLTEIIERIGTNDWELVSKEMKKRTARQCRERWINYLSPELRNDPWTEEEDKLLDELYAELGSRWHKIAEYFPTRSGNCVRNRFKLRQRRALRQKKKAQKANSPIYEEASPSSEDSADQLTNIITLKPDQFSNVISFKSEEDVFDIFNAEKGSVEEWLGTFI